MSLLGKVALFVVRGVAEPVLAEFGREVGTAIGKRLAEKIHPEEVVEEGNESDEESEGDDNSPEWDRSG